MAWRLRVWAMALLCGPLAACGNPLSRGHAVATRDEAIAAAKTALIGTPQAAGPFTVVREAATWDVSTAAGGASKTTVYVSDKTGQTLVATDDPAEPARPADVPRP
jgi:hypothetical protein